MCIILSFKKMALYILLWILSLLFILENIEKDLPCNSENDTFYTIVK